MNPGTYPIVAIKEQEKEVRRSAVVNHELVNLSVTQIGKFDPREEGGCNRRWWREYVLRDRPEQTAAQTRGDDFHRSIEHYLKTGNAGMLPQRVLMNRHLLPRPGDDLLVEWKFGPGEALELAIAGVPLNGKIDLLHNRGRVVRADGSTHDEDGGRLVAEVVDWKTTSKIASYAKPADKLPELAQMAVYAVIAKQVYPHVDRVRLSHGYFQTAGPRDADKRSVIVTLDTVNSSWQRVEAVARSMRDVAREREFLKVEPNFEACTAFKGCPYRAHCPRSAGQAAEDLFGKGIMQSLLSRGKSPPPAAAPAPAQTTPPPAGGPAQSSLARALNRPVPAGAPPISPEVAAEAARLAAAQAQGTPAYSGTSPGAPMCFYCGEALSPTNASRLQNGTYKHIGCAKAPAEVLPPDAPKSQPHLAAQAVPPEVLATLPPQVQAAIAEVERAAAASAQAAGASAEPVAPAKKPSTRKKPSAQAGVAEHGPPVTMTNGAAQLPAGQVVHVTHAAPAQVEHAPPEGFRDHDGPESGIGLFVNVVYQGADLPNSLEGYLQEKVSALCSRYRAADLQCAPDDTPLAYGKWKGALAALVRAEPPPPGVYLVMIFDGDEVRGVLVRTLTEIADFVVRGVR